tara:strand:+ start:1323 stop:1682 length:360 start_codon:yes stop_codon:yes gene_type:complete
MAKKSSKIEELKSKVESLKQKGTILKISELEGKAFVMKVSATSTVNGQYGEQLLIEGTYEEGELEVEGQVRLYLNGARQERFQEAIGANRGCSVAFVFGNKVQLKSGHDYVPLELVETV